MSHYIKTFGVVTVFALIAVGSSFAASILQVHNGQNIRAGKVLCIVRSSGVTCGADPQRVTATINKSGVVLMVGNKAKYVCLASGVCVKP